LVVGGVGGGGGSKKRESGRWGKKKLTSRGGVLIAFPGRSFMRSLRKKGYKGGAHKKEEAMKRDRFLCDTTKGSTAWG